MVAFEFIFVESILIPVLNDGMDECLVLARMCEPKSETECLWNQLGMDFGSYGTFHPFVLKVSSVLFCFSKLKNE